MQNNLHLWDDLRSAILFICDIIVYLLVWFFIYMIFIAIIIMLEKSHSPSTINEMFAILMVGFALATLLIVQAEFTVALFRRYR